MDNEFNSFQPHQHWELKKVCKLFLFVRGINFEHNLTLLFTVLVEQKGKVLQISAEIRPSPRQSNLMKEVQTTEKKFCPKCTLGLDIKHTDVLILKQYLREDGTMMPRRVTGLCNIQQKNIGTMVLMARRAGTINFHCRTKTLYI